MNGRLDSKNPAPTMRCSLSPEPKNNNEVGSGTAFTFRLPDPSIRPEVKQFRLKALHENITPATHREFLYVVHGLIARSSVLA